MFVRVLGCLGGFSPAEKNKKIQIFLNFSKNFSAGIFLVIGVKPGKSSGMGEERKHFKSGSWEVEKKWEDFSLLSSLPGLNRAGLPGLGDTKKSSRLKKESADAPY